MAHVQKRERNGDVRWVARLPTPDGGERSKTFDRKVDAERWVLSQEHSKATGAWVDPQAGRITFEVWAERWWDGLTGRRRSTRAVYRGIVDNHLVPYFEGWPIAEITPSDVKALIADRLGEGLSSGWVRKVGNVLSLILAEAVAERRLASNPVDVVNLPIEKARKMRVLEPEQIVDLTEAVRPHYRPLIFTAAYVGMRWGELAGLKLDRVDLLRKTITVDQALVEVSGQLSWGPPKTKAGVRTVSVPGGLVEMLAEHFASEPVQTSGLAFPTVSGVPMRRSNFRKLWVRAVERVGWVDGHPLEGFVFHELRHTAASLAIAAGAHPLTIKERLGHSSITVTMDRYGHLFPAQDEALAQALDGVFRAAGTGPRRDGNGTVREIG